MTALLIVAAGLVGSLVGSELALGGRRLQTGLSRVLAVWAATFVVTAAALVRQGGIGPVAVTIFWGGAFLSWFGIRSHIESSILLRMLYLLKRNARSETRLLADYESQYGESIRVEELLRSGLAAKTGDRLSVAPKGRAILRIVAKLR